MKSGTQINDHSILSNTPHSSDLPHASKAKMGNPTQFTELNIGSVIHLIHLIAQRIILYKYIKLKYLYNYNENTS